MTMRRSTIFFLFFLLPLSMGFVFQEPPVTDVVETALNLIHERCEVLSRDQACYGNARLVAEPRAGLTGFQFADAGDIEDLARIQSLRLSALDPVAETWGVTLMRLRANLPETGSEQVTLIAFGDVELENAVLPTTEISVTVNTSSYINARLSPSTAVGVAGTLAPGQMTTAVERLADSSWLRVKLLDTDKTGWVRADLLASDDDVESLNVADRAAPFYQPMQAFYFASGSNERATMPTNGLLIQTPEGVGEVQLLINEINIQLGSTVFFEAQAGAEMRISTLEGHADVRANGVEFTAFAGTMVTVPLDDSLKPTGSPTAPQPYEQAMLVNLPLPALERPVEVAPPLTWTEIQAEIEEAADEEPDENDSEAGGQPDCPANSCNAPGQEDDCPGNSCNAPGHNDDCPGNSCNALGQDDDDDCPGNSCNAPGQNKNK